MLVINIVKETKEYKITEYIFNKTKRFYGMSLFTTDGNEVVVKNSIPTLEEIMIWLSESGGL